MAMRLTDAQLEWLAERVPDAPVSDKGGRPPMDKRRIMGQRISRLDVGHLARIAPERSAFVLADPP